VGLRCTCGAALPDDARFCHKCGKPQFEEDIARLTEPEAAPVPVQAPLEPPSEPAVRTVGISFRDTRAVATTVAMAVAAFFALMLVTMALPGLAPVLFPLVLLAAGFFVPAAYRKASASALSTAAGARLGWMTGVWFFLAVVIVVTLGTLVLSTAEGTEAMRQLKSNPQFSQMKISTPHDLASGLLMSAIPTFLLVTLLPGLGGMLGARFWGRNR
jgi:hypothetical protein